MKAKREYLEAIRYRYYRGNRAEKSRILDEFCSVTGIHRKAGIRVLNRLRDEPSYRNRLWLKPKLEKRKPGRKSRYLTDFEFCISCSTPTFQTKYFSNLETLNNISRNNFI